MSFTVLMVMDPQDVELITSLWVCFGPCGTVTGELGLNQEAETDLQMKL